MWKNYQASKIQYFYRKFVKCPRDNETLCKIKLFSNHTSYPSPSPSKSKSKYIEIPSPVDPLYRIPYEEKNHFRLLEWNPKPMVWHFNILTLIEWLNISKEMINPMTNCLFMNKSIDKILEFLEKKNLRKKLKVKIAYNHKEFTPKKIVCAPSYVGGAIYMDLLIKSIIDNDEGACFNLLNNNYEKIVQDYFKIDEDINKSINILGKNISPVGALHFAISKMNKDIVHHLIYYGCNLEKKSQGYTPLHIAAILNQPQLGILLKLYGANLEEECEFMGKTSTIYDICDILGHNDFIIKILS